MDISLYLTNFLQYRITEGATFIELYIADQYEKGVLDFLIKDDAAKFEDEEILAFNKLKLFCDQTNGHIKHLYHRKQTTVQVSWLTTAEGNPIRMDGFSSLFAVLILSHPNINFVFSYLTIKGEYVFSSQGLFKEFSKHELEDKETLMVFIDILKKEIDILKI